MLFCDLPCPCIRTSDQRYTNVSPYFDRIGIDHPDGAGISVAVFRIVYIPIVPGLVFRVLEAPDIHKAQDRPTVVGRIRMVLVDLWLTCLRIIGLLQPDDPSLIVITGLVNLHHRRPFAGLPYAHYGISIGGPLTER